MSAQATLGQFVRYATVGLASNVVLYLAYLALTATGVGAKLAMSVLYLLGVVSISLAVVNLLPLPAFDGIQIMVAFLALITGHTIKMRTYYVLQVAGVLFIIVVFIALAGSDLQYLLSLRR